MSVIKVENVSKRYRLGVQDKAYTFAGQLKNTLTYPVRNFRRIAQLKKFDEENDPSVFWALKDINFEVNQGEVLGIIGRNGAGKSTLLKVLSRITEPTSGQIKIKGRVSSLLEVGTGFHPELTGRDNVYMNGTILGMTKKEIDVKFDEIVDFSGVEQHIDTHVKFYSSGMKVRLGFSVAAHLEPEILIIDEVLAVGDFEFQKRCLGKMDDVAKSCRTVLFVSHNMASVRMLCSKGLILNSGQISKIGDVDNSVNEYLGLKSTQSMAFKELLDVGSKFLKLNYIAFKNSSGKIVNNFTNQEEINIELSFDIRKESDDIKLLMTLSNQLGVEILTSFHNDYRQKTFNKGINTIQLCIPKLLLYQGKYFVTIKAGIHNVKWIYELDNVLSFDVDFQPLNNKMLNKNKRTSVIAPVIEWK